MTLSIPPHTPCRFKTGREQAHLPCSSVPTTSVVPLTLVWNLLLCLAWLATDLCWNWKKSALGSPSQAFCDRSLCQKPNMSYCSLEAFCLGMGQGRVTDSVESGCLAGETLTDNRQID